MTDTVAQILHLDSAFGFCSPHHKVKHISSLLLPHLLSIWEASRVQRKRNCLLQLIRQHRARNECSVAASQCGSRQQLLRIAAKPKEALQPHAQAVPVGLPRWVQYALSPWF